MASFPFFGADPAALVGEKRQVFRGSFPGVHSFGWSTLVVVTEASAGEQVAAIEHLTGQVAAHCRAPDLPQARAAAEEEVAFAQTLCNDPSNTLLGIQLGAEGDGLRKILHTLHQRGNLSSFRIVAADAEDTEVEATDFAVLTRGNVRR